MNPLFADSLADALFLCKQFGPFLLAVIFFLWRDWKREDRMGKRIDVLEDEQRKTLLPLVRECTVVITRNTAVMERLEKALLPTEDEHARHESQFSSTDATGSVHAKTRVRGVR